MNRISLFAEDYGHEAVLMPLIECVAAQYCIPVKIRRVSVRGGAGQVEAELKEYVQALIRYREELPDLLVVATDANCQGVAVRRQKLQKTAEPIKDSVVFAVPDPHVERWLLRDPAAFKAAMGTACRAPDQKCDRDRYKNLLIRAICDAGKMPLLGGMEYAEQIVKQMDLAPTSQNDDFSIVLQELHSHFRLRSQRARR